MRTYNNFILLVWTIISGPSLIVDGLKSTWIENLGCIHIPNSGKVLYNVAIGTCYFNCLNTNNTTYFAFRDFKINTTCICLPHFDINTHVCNSIAPAENRFQLYNALPTLTVSSIYPCTECKCAYTSCKSINGKNFTSSNFIATDCGSLYKAICVSGVKRSENAKFQDAILICDRIGSFLPGRTKFPCNEISAKSQGSVTSKFWSSLQLVSYNEGFISGITVSSMHKSTSLRNITQRPSVGRTVTERIGRMSTGTVFKTSYTVNNKSRDTNESEDNTLGIAVGVSVSTIVIVAVIFFALLYHKRFRQPARNVQKVPLSDVTTEDTNCVTRHQPGLINGDEYAVVETVRRISLTAGSSPLPVDESQPEYDHITHTPEENPRDLSQNTYDVANHNYDSEYDYDKTRPAVRISDNLEHYDHV